MFRSKKIMTLDPAHLTKKQAQLLDRLLKAKEGNAEAPSNGNVNPKTNRTVFECNKSYDFIDDKGIEYSIIFSKKLVRRQRKHPDKHTHKYLYTVYVDDRRHLIGRGSYASVYPVLGKLKYSSDNEPLSYHPSKPEKENIIREQVIRNSKLYSSEQHHIEENEIAKQIDYLHTKEITFKEENGKKTQSYMEMRNLGEDLDVFLKRMKGKLSLKELFLICISSLKALRDFHRNGFIHRDVKLANMMIKNWVVRLADVGFSRKIEKKDNIGVGTPAYSAPEMVAAPATAGLEADLYSLGVIFRQLFEDQFVLDQIYQKGVKLEDITQRKTQEYTNRNQYKPLGIKFSLPMENLLSKISNESKQKLIATLQGMTHPDPAQRFTCDQALENFSEISGLALEEEPTQSNSTVDNDNISLGNSFGVIATDTSNVVAHQANPPKLNPADPAWLPRMKEIVATIDVADYGRTAKATYVYDAIALVKKAIAQRARDGDERVLDMFKVLMICCFQNKNGTEFFRSAYTKTGLSLETALRERKYEGGPAELRSALFGEQYRTVVPNYTDMINTIFTQQIAKYPLDNTSQKKICEDICFEEILFGTKIIKIAYANKSANKIDVVRTASLLMTKAHPQRVTVPLTVQSLCHEQLFKKYNAICTEQIELRQPVKKTAS